jgi:acetamidase/formamidase
MSLIKSNSILMACLLTLGVLASPASQAQADSASPTVHKLAASPNTTHTGFWDNSFKPVLTINSGDVVSMEISTLMDGQLKPGLSFDDIMKLRTSYVAKKSPTHTLTGPIFVKGAEPGDVLEVRIIKLVPHDYGYTWFLPGALKTGTIPEDFPEGWARGFYWNENKYVDFGSGGIKIPLQPFLGTMGVAPATQGKLSTTPPGVHGGNMDLRELQEGTILYLPVHVKGALFSAGDAHAVQGDGEVSLAALETGMKEARLGLRIRKDMKLNMPMAETPSDWIFMGYNKSLDEAVKIALREAIKWLSGNKGLTNSEAYALLSLAASVRVTQTVDIEKGIHVMVPKNIFGK